jgi:hypothetical protein
VKNSTNKTKNYNYTKTTLILRQTKKIPYLENCKLARKKNSGKSAKKADNLINDEISHSVSNYVSYSNSNFSSKKKKHSRSSRSFLSNPQEIGKTYKNLKKTKLNDEFESRENQTEASNLESASSKYIDT